MVSHVKSHSYVTRHFPLPLNTGVASCLVIMEIDLLHISDASNSASHIQKSEQHTVVAKE